MLNFYLGPHEALAAVDKTKAVLKAVDVKLRGSEGRTRWADVKS